MNKLFLLSFILACGTSLVATADDDFGEFESGDLFADDTSSQDQKPQAQQTTKTLSSFISSRIPASSAKSIENAEKVFCYTVDYAAADYNGYTIDDLAVTGSCGELSTDGRNLVRDMILNNNLAFSTAKDACNISPKIMLRYIYGVDYTDVLISAPCHSVTFFHGRDISTINAAPGKNIIEQIVTTYSSLRENFLSPALLGQMVANGQVLTQDQKEIVRKINTGDSPKKWNNASSNTENEQVSTPQPARKGWNRLK